MATSPEIPTKKPKGNSGNSKPVGKPIPPKK